MCVRVYIYIYICVCVNVYVCICVYIYLYRVERTRVAGNIHAGLFVDGDSSKVPANSSTLCDDSPFDRDFLCG